MNDPRSVPSARAPRRRLYRWLAAVPSVAMLGGVPFANRVEPHVLGLPFLLFWVALWVALTGPVMGVIYMLDESAARRGVTGRRIADAE